ncbi:DUF3237 domain-containing protein [Nonomuraea cavernae]|uniref:UPF0311 protein n=1 Tax=Nonomuraea cavernae TaxID=2045107 RepID=A0A918DJ61_9ACTN|nr:DUF3237 domain-containing protein [Nonomuraea cavernae]MCA2185987.1 DUF3237 domain-containing protein [Nonomuraea cavernae]GGO69028.1 UPF0311 protein [Nonomuraea cavernae]
MNLLDTDPVATALKAEHLCDFAITFASVRTIATPAATRIIATIAQGTVEGPRLRGGFLAGGGDWITLGTDGIARMDVRATILTHDGELVYVTSTGRAGLSDVAINQLMAGETIAWDQMHARSAPLFETGADRYAWLNGTITMAINELSLNHVNYRIYAIR